MSGNTGTKDATGNPNLGNDVDEEEVEYEEEMVEEEVEVTDNEAEGESETVQSTPTASPEKGGKGKAPGKVNPSKEVKGMVMRTPTSGGSRPAALPTDKDPFPIFGDWSPSTLAQIEICFPILTGKDETTNELTRSTKPEARYWKAPVVFRYGSHTSQTLRFNNVHIPFHTAKGYGSGFVYMCLPGFVGDAFAEAGKRRAPTKVGENSLVPDHQRWWKIANNVENAFGVISHDTKKFHTKSLESIFDGTQSGISCSVILSFKCKASTMEKEQLRPTTVRTVAVEVVRGFINEIDINVQMPVRVNKRKTKVEPVASTADVATDTLMKRLGELGL